MRISLIKQTILQVWLRINQDCSVLKYTERKAFNHIGNERLRYCIHLEKTTWLTDRLTPSFSLTGHLSCDWPADLISWLRSAYDWHDWILNSLTVRSHVSRCLINYPTCLYRDVGAPRLPKCKVWSAYDWQIHKAFSRWRMEEITWLSARRICFSHLFFSPWLWFLVHRNSLRLFWLPLLTIGLVLCRSWSILAPSSA